MPNLCWKVILRNASSGSINAAREITYGVPQVAVLGPLLFTVNSNSLLSLDIHGSILSLADDTAVFYKS